MLKGASCEDTVWRPLETLTFWGEAYLKLRICKLIIAIDLYVAADYLERLCDVSVS